MSQIISNEKFLEKLNNINSELIPLEPYQGCEIPILFKCKICGLPQRRKPVSITAYKQGCTDCTEKRRIEHLHFTDEKFREKLKLKNPNMEAVEKYIDMATPISFKCLKCGSIEKHDPHSILKSKVGGCKNCRTEALKKSRTLTDDYFKNKVHEKNPDVKLLDTYSGNKSMIHCQCMACNNRWATTAQSLLAGHGCPVCGYVKNGAKLMKTNECFIEELSNINSRIKPLEKYAGCSKRIKCKCLSCGKTFSAIAGNLLGGSDCPYCKMSKNEKTINSWLKARHITNTSGKTFFDLTGTGNGHLSYDFYLPKFNLLIEFQGQQHYRAVDYFGGEAKFKIQQEHDRRKSEYAKQHGINLLCIRYDENVEEVLDLWFRTHKPKPWIKIKYISKLESVETAGQAWQQAC